MNHLDKDGNIILIAEMSDEHLQNTIRYFVKRLRGAKDIFNQTQNPFDKKLYGRKFNKSAAGEYIEEFFGKVGVYVLEANLRNLDIKETLDTLRIIVNRDKAMPMVLDVEYIEYNFRE